MARRVFLDETMQRDLVERGYTITRLLSREEAAAVLEEIRALSPADAFVPDGTGRYPATYHCTFLDPDHEYRRAVDTLNRRVFEERMCGLLDDYRMLTSNLYVKPPGVGRFEVHQNWPVTDDIRDTTLTLWCPFTDVGSHNGTIHVVPGSHKIVPDVFTIGAPKYFEQVYDELVERWLEPVTLEAGECIVFDDGLLHWSDENASAEFRWSAQLVFLPTEKTPVMYYFDAEHDPPRFELYEISPEFFIDREMADAAGRPDDLSLVNHAEVYNRVVTRDQFVQLMEAGPQTRAAIYAGASIAEAFAEVRTIIESESESESAGASGGEAAQAPQSARPSSESRRSLLRAAWRRRRIRAS